MTTVAGASGKVMEKVIHGRGALPGHQCNFINITAGAVTTEEGPRAAAADHLGVRRVRVTWWPP